MSTIHLRIPVRNWNGGRLSEDIELRDAISTFTKAHLNESLLMQL